MELVIYADTLIYGTPEVPDARNYAPLPAMSLHVIADFRITDAFCKTYVILKMAKRAAIFRFCTLVLPL